MSTLTVSAPTLSLSSPKSWGSRSAIEGQLRKIWSNYGKSIQFASKESGIDPKILTSFISIESGGNPNAGSGSIKGLMQFNANYVNEQLKNEFNSGRLSDNEKAVLKKYGFTFDSKGNTRQFTTADSIKPELNILVGSIILGQLADQGWAKDSNGNLKLSAIITSYNSGIYSKWSKIAQKSNSADPKVIHDMLQGNSTTQSYIRKMFGVDGALDIASNELKNIIVA